MSNGILGGAVSITGVCDRVEPWSALLIGLFGGVAYSFSCKLTLKLGVDDPIEATQVHGACGLWGIIAIGIFDTKYGLVSDYQESIKLFGVQAFGAIVIVFWVTLCTVPYFLIMKKLNLLRVPLIHEVIGLDIAEMGSRAYIDNLIAQAIYREH